MALVVKDRVQETSTTTGTGSLTLLGAVTGFQTFSSAIGNTNTTYYTIQGNGEWEVGIGTVSASALSRDSVLESSNGGSLVNFSAGSKFVFCTYPAEKSVDIETAQTLTNKTIDGSNNTLSNIANSSLTNSAITINGTSTSLGGSINVGTVTSVSGTGTVSGISLSGTVTSSGDLTLGGSLDLSSPPAIGGTSANTGKFTTLNYTSALQNNGNSAYSVKGDYVIYDSGTNATYTPSSGVRAFLVEVVGGGGGGGGVDGAGAGTNAGAQSGGGGGYSSVFVTDLTQTFKYTVGAAGTGGAAGNNAGTGGGTSFFYGGGSGTTVLAQATGGSSGAGAAGSAGNSSAVGASGGAGSVGTLNLEGSRSTSRCTVGGISASISLSGSSPKFGGGKSASSLTSNGTDATNYGEGGAAGNAFAVATNYAGGNGFSGVIIITEYY
jgi:hypothetical protein